MNKKLIPPKEVAALLHISIATVNYYTNIGLLYPSERKGNMRLYDKNAVLSIFERIKALRRQGYSLKLIRSQLRH